MTIIELTAERAKHRDSVATRTDGQVPGGDLERGPGRGRRAKALLVQGAGFVVAAEAPPIGNECEAHPDHALFELHERYAEAERTSREAAAAHSVAYDQFWTTLGPCPAALRVTGDDYARLTHPGSWRLAGRLVFPFIPEFEGDDPDVDANAFFRTEAWTPQALSRAIAIAVPVFGWGGSTPRRIGRFRSLLPIAEEYFGRHDRLDRELRLSEMAAESRRAADQLAQLSEKFSRAHACTLEGLAIISARMNEFDWEGMPASWRNLLRSAAAVTGIAMREPRFDVARWIVRLEQVGGRWSWDRKKDESSICWPIDHTRQKWRRDEIRDLNHDFDEYGDAIRQWMHDQAWAA